MNTTVLTLLLIHLICGLATLSAQVANCPPVNLTLVENSRAIVGDVDDRFQVTPDGSHVVYRADQDTEDVIELYSVPVAGGAPVKLNGPLPHNGDVKSFEITPDGSHVIYLTIQDTVSHDDVFEFYSASIVGGVPVKINDIPVSGTGFTFQVAPTGLYVFYRLIHNGVDELYSVPVAGGASVKLASGDISSFRFTPDSSRILYLRRPAFGGGFRELYSVPVAGGSPVKLNGPMTSGGSVDGFQIIPDGSRVVYFADQDMRDVFELYSVSVTGGAPVMLNGPLFSNRDVEENFQITPDSSRVLYLADQDALNAPDLYSVPVAGGSPVKLNDPLVNGRDVGGDFQITPDGSRVVYRADHVSNWVIDLYSVPVAGGSPVKLNHSLPPFGFNNVSGFQVTPDGSRVVYRADQDSDGVYELYSAPFAGGNSVKLNGPLSMGYDVRSDFQITPDGSHVVYLAVQDNFHDDVFELYSVPVAGGPPVELSGPLNFGKAVLNFQITSAKSRVIYFADQDTDEVFELYSVPVSGGTSVKLNGRLANGGDVDGQFQITPGSSHVFYRAVQDTDRVSELYSVPVAGGASIRRNSPLAFDRDVGDDFQITPDGSRVVYRADQDTDEVFELYSAPIAGGSPVNLNGLLSYGENIASDFQITPDGSHVVYRVTKDSSENIELFSVPVAGGPPVKLNSPLARGLGVDDDFQISPDSLRVVYRLYRFDIDELYSVSVTGGVTVQLVSNRVLDFRIAPDGARVVYRADQDSESTYELYSIPIAGGASVKLNGPLPTGGDVGSFQISPDGSCVIYGADQETIGVYELFSVPTAGGDYVKLTHPLSARERVRGGFKITPDGSRVLYGTGQFNVENLYSVPVAGGASTDLNGPLLSSGDVRGFQITPDGSSIVYIADQEVPGVFEIFSVPVVGGVPVKLNDPLPEFGDVDDFQVSPDGAWVVYRAGKGSYGIDELYSVSLAGGAPKKLNDPLPSFGDVFDFQITPDSSRVVYRADQDSDEIFDLYSVPIFCTSQETPREFFVDLSATGANDGSSWNDAFSGLQEALAVSSRGDTIRVAAGLYYPSALTDPQNPRSATFLLKDQVTLLGGYPPDGGGSDSARNPIAHPTILTGDIGVPLDQTDNAFHVLTAEQIAPETLIDGFHIESGRADGSNTSYYENKGGGLLLIEGFPTIRNCIFRGNHATSSGGEGGSLYAMKSSARLVNCRFLDNEAGTGGAIRAVQSELTIEGCDFRNNLGHAEGGAISNENTHFQTGRSGQYLNTTFVGNRGRGGAIHDENSDRHFGQFLTITNCVFSGNLAHLPGYEGGAVYNSLHSALVFINCSLHGNLAQSGGGAVYNGHLSSPTFINCIIWGNGVINAASNTSSESMNRIGPAGPGGPIVLFGPVTFRHCLVEHWDTDTLESYGVDSFGNLDGTDPANEPLFLEPIDLALVTPPVITGDLRLALGSPAIDSGLNLANPLTVDIQGGFRVQSGLIDLGAHEANGLNFAALWQSDFDEDQISFGLEIALGRDLHTPDFPRSSPLVVQKMGIDGPASLSFARNSSADQFTTWIVERSPILEPEAFVEVYRFHGASSADELGAGISAEVTDQGFTITDASAVSDRFFYRLKASYTP